MRRLSVSTCPATSSVAGHVVGNATAFFYIETESSVWLVTNWHVVMGGRDPAAPHLSPTGAVPDRLELTLHCETDPGHLSLSTTASVEIPLYDAGQRPRWLEHPVHRQLVDVVAVELAAAELRGLAYTTICDAEHGFESRYEPRVMDAAFVVGYPLGLTGGGRSLPLYKRATVASEPAIDVGGLPKFLIDGSTVRGLSGAPVVCSHSGLWAPDDLGARSGDAIVGTVENMVGVYSGRLTSTQLAAGVNASSIGVVWKRRAVDEIIEGHVLGRPLADLV